MKLVQETKKLIYGKKIKGMIPQEKSKPQEEKGLIKRFEEEEEKDMNDRNKESLENKQEKEKEKMEIDIEALEGEFMAEDDKKDDDLLELEKEFMEGGNDEGVENYNIVF